MSIWNQLKTRLGLFFAGVLITLGAMVVAIFADGKVAAFSAFFAAIGSFASLILVVEVQRERKARERPYITAYFEVKGGGLVYFNVHNSGNSPAFDIRIEFQDAPKQYQDQFLVKDSPFKSSIDMLLPEKTVNWIVDAHHKLLAKNRDTRFKFSVSYRSIFREEYRENIDIDLAYLRGTPLPQKATSEQIAELTKAVNRLEKQLNKVIYLDAFAVRTETRDQWKTRWNREIEGSGTLPLWKERLKEILYFLLEKLK